MNDPQEQKASRLMESLLDHTFEDNLEQKHAAKEILVRAMDQNSNGQENYDSGLAERNLEANKRIPRWGWICFCSVVLGLGLLVIGYHGWKVNKARQLMLGMNLGLPLAPADDPYAGAFDHLDESQRLLLFGDKTQISYSDRWKALWDSEPDNAAYYIEYVQAYEFDYSSYPPDMIKKGDQLDPGNAWFRVVQSGILAKEAVEKKVVPRKSGPRRPTRGKHAVPGAKKESEPTDPVLKKLARPLAEWEVKNEADYEKAKALFYETAAMQSCNSRMQDLLNERVPLIPQGGDWITRVIPIVYLSDTHYGSLMVNYTSRILQIEAQRCKQEGDQQGLRTLIMCWDNMGKNLADGSVTLIDALVARAWVMSNLPHLRDAAKACDMPEEEKRFADLYVQMLREKQERDDRHESFDDADDEYRKSGILSRLVAPVLDKQLNDPSKIDPVDLKPGRMTDHAFLGRVGSAAGWKLFALLALAMYLNRFRKGIVVRKLNLGLRGFLGVKDQVWVFLLGVVVPVLYFVVINGLSPWSARHYSVFYAGFLPIIGQWLCLLLLLLIVPPAAVNWRLHKVCPMIGKTGMRCQLASIACAAIAMPLFGVFGFGMAALIFASGVAILSMVLILVHWIAVVPKKRLKLKLGVVVCTLIPVYALASLVLAMMVLGYHAEEKYWVSQDDTLKIPVKNAAFTKTESQVTRQVIVELKQTMGWSD